MHAARPIRVEPDRPHRWPAAATWAAAWVAMAALDGVLDVANLALILVLAAAIAAMWLPPPGAMAACAVAVLAFNVAFVPPRGVLDVELRQHALLLATMLAVSWIVSLLVARQRRLAATERELASRAGRLRAFGDALRDADDPSGCASRLAAALASATGGAIVLRWRQDATPDGPSPEGLGDASPDEEAGLRAAMHESRPIGAGTDRRATMPTSFLPLRGRASSFGAALVRWPAGAAAGQGAVEHAQALCDAMGLALERAGAVRAAVRAREDAQAQVLRGTLLAAIAHDHRTPLATILGAATSLRDQADRLDDAGRRRLADTIVDEASHLARLVDNTLQLARLDAPGVAIALDWESAEELVGAAVARVRRRAGSDRVRTTVEPGLPLLRVDAVLVTQLLDNLLTNAMVHGAPDAPVEVAAERRGDSVVVAVRDRGGGPSGGVPTGTDGSAPPPGLPDGARAGTGLGLEVCRAIARVHGGALVLRERPGGGTEAECALPVAEAPRPPDPEGR